MSDEQTWVGDDSLEVQIVELSDFCHIAEEIFQLHKNSNQQRYQDTSIKTQQIRKIGPPMTQTQDIYQHTLLNI